MNEHAFYIANGEFDAIVDCLDASDTLLNQRFASYPVEHSAANQSLLRNISLQRNRSVEAL
jgi:hypothetical protein